MMTKRSMALLYRRSKSTFKVGFIEQVERVYPKGQSYKKGVDIAESIADLHFCRWVRP